VTPQLLLGGLGSLRGHFLLNCCSSQNAAYFKGICLNHFRQPCVPANGQRCVTDDGSRSYIPRRLGGNRRVARGASIGGLDLLVGELAYDRTVIWTKHPRLYESAIELHRNIEVGSCGEVCGCHTGGQSARLILLDFAVSLSECLLSHLLVHIRPRSPHQITLAGAQEPWICTDHTHLQSFSNSARSTDAVCDGGSSKPSFRNPSLSILALEFVTPQWSQVLFESGGSWSICLDSCIW